MSKLIEELKRVADGQYWYLATPYKKYPDGINMAFRHACLATAWFVSHRVAVFSPIAHSHPVVVYGGLGLDPLDHTLWIPANEPLMRGSCGLAIVHMPGWDESYGIQQEQKFFEKRGMPIIHLDWPLPC